MDPLRAPQAGGFAHLASKPVVPQRPFDPFAAIDEQRGTAPPVDPFMGKQPVDKWAGPSQRDNIDPGNMAYAPPKVIPAAPFGEVDFDALLGDTPLTPPPASSGPVAEFGQHGVMAKPAAPFNPQDFDIDDLLGDEPRGSSPATSAAASTPASAPLAATSPFGDDPGSPFHEPPRVPAEAPPLTAVDHAAQAVAVTVAETPIAAPTAPSADAALLLAAFLAGAGVPDLDLSKQNPEEYFKSMGALFRVMVESLRDVLMSRAEVKRGFGVEQTMLRARNNNALKFSPTAEDAVAALLQPDRKGYLPPLRATEEAFADLRSHQLAVMAGVQTALLGLLKRFDPAALETRLKKGSVIDTLLPSSRKARYWELFCETYKDIAGEAEDDFQAVFGKEFAKAYKEQEGKL